MKTLSALILGGFLLAGCQFFADESECTCADGSPCPATGCPIPE